jgi:hypothetical protein
MNDIDEQRKLLWPMKITVLEESAATIFRVEEYAEHEWNGKNIGNGELGQGLSERTGVRRQ